MSRLKFLLFAVAIIIAGIPGQSALARQHAGSDTVPPSPTLRTIGLPSPFKPLGRRRAKLRKGNAYAITLAEEALPAGRVPKIVAGHPRLLLRPSPWKYGLSLAQLRARARKEPWARQVAIDMKKPPAKNYPPVITHRALLYLLTGDESLVPQIVKHILAAKPQYNCGGGLVQTALWYDWIYNSSTVSDAQRRQMADKIAEVALQCAKIFESGHAFDLWTHRASPGWVADVLVAGLVLDDDHPEAAKLRRWGMGYFKKNYFRAWQHNGGCWLHGGSSYNVGLIMPEVIACWASAVAGEDIYEIIRRNYGDWLKGHLLYMMSEVLPDKTRSDAVAWDYAPSKLRIKGRNFYWPAASACQMPLFYTFQRWLGEDPRSGYYGRLIRILFYDEKIAARESPASLEQPFSKLWGRYGPGYLQLRSRGWAPDSTVIEFKCGDWVWTHSQANHNNSFWIYHQGRLVVQGGCYGLDKTWHGGAGSHYFTQSISSNTMLIFQPGEFTHPGGPHAGDLEPPGVIPNPGGQRMRWACGQTCFTFDEYLRRKKEESNIEAGLFETGDITAFEYAPDYRYAYVAGDATMAYNNPRFCYWYQNRKTGELRHNRPKIDLFTRSMVYFRETDDLVIFDRVQSLDPAWRKAWLAHFQGKPEVVDGRLLKAEVPGHIEEFAGNIVRMTWADGVLKPPDPKNPGCLFIRTFLPVKHYVRRIGGDGYEAWWNGKNRTGDGHKIIDKVDAGRWRIEVSPAEPRKFDNFLHLLHICDAKTEKMPPAAMIESRNRRLVGVTSGGWLVMFGRTGQVDSEVSYRVPAGKTRNLVVDLPPGRRCLVSGPVAGGRELTVSSEGTVNFISTGPGMVVLTLGSGR